MDHTDTQHPLRTIRLPPDQIRRILDDLDAVPAAGHSQRRDPRFPYRIREVVVHMQQPGFNEPMTFVVPTRNISTRGLSFLHGGFVHPGTLCVVQLVTSQSVQHKVVAVVRRCRYIESNIHEVAVQFKRAIDLVNFCSDTVRARVLLGEDDAALARLVSLHLGRLNCVITHAMDGQGVLDHAAKSVFDSILLDMELPVMDGFAVAKTLRENGYTGMIVAATALTQPADKQRCLDAGCDRYLPKPFGRDELAELMAAIPCDPIFSALQNDPSMTDLIEDFVAGLAAKLRGLEQSLAAKNLEGLQQVTRSLKAEGRGFGFEIITTTATLVEERLLAGEKIESVAPDIRALIRLCLQARAARPQCPTVSESAPAADPTPSQENGVRTAAEQ